MKFIKTKFFPPFSYSAIMLFMICFHKIDLNEKQKLHELIHGKQYIETTIFSFIALILLNFIVSMNFSIIFLAFFMYYIIYLLEYLIKFIICKNQDLAYKSISFEQEAYYGSRDENYLKTRKHFAWFKYIKTMYKKTVYLKS